MNKLNLTPGTIQFPGKQNDKNLYRLAYCKSENNDKLVVHVQRNFQQTGEFDGVPSGWYLEQVKYNSSLCIDGGQDWMVYPTREAWEELLTLMEKEPVDLKEGEIICPQCEGKRRLGIKVISNGTESISRLGCVYCNETGKRKEAEYKAEQEFIENEHCKCGQHYGSSYVPNGQGIIAKHHWTCNNCGKITQIG